MIVLHSEYMGRDWKDPNAHETFDPDDHTTASEMVPNLHGSGTTNSTLSYQQFVDQHAKYV